MARWGWFSADASCAPRGVLSLVHHTHSAAAQPLDNSVMRDRLADELRGRYHRVGMR